MRRLTVPVSTTFRQLVNKILRMHLRGEKNVPLFAVANAVNSKGDKVYALVRADFTIEGVHVQVPLEEPDVVEITIPAVKEYP